ncbi:unnamed protein product [marine sediment metagenome]|uniref:Homeodomain phBC6A51-type domain-containing protein n=2 Tax=marine sediment metagenome TaxID=412755 RepID=X1QKQ9_9ZZZZ
MKKEESKEKKDQFVIKRGLEGKSFDTIAKELTITKVTLIKWSKEFKEDISDLEDFEKEKIIEKYKAGKRIRLEAMLKIRDKILTVIEKRNLSEVSFSSLMKNFIEVEKLLDGNLNLNFYTGETKNTLEDNLDWSTKEILRFDNSFLNLNKN